MKNQDIQSATGQTTSRKSGLTFAQCVQHAHSLWREWVGPKLPTEWTDAEWERIRKSATQELRYQKCVSGCGLVVAEIHGKLILLGKVRKAWRIVQ